MTSQESMLTLAQPACINKCFILHQQSVQNMKSLMLEIPSHSVSVLWSLLRSLCLFKGPLSLPTVFETHIYIPLKEQKNGETRVKRDNFAWQERDKESGRLQTVPEDGTVLLLKSTNVSLLYGSLIPDKYIKMYEILISPTDHNKVWVCQRCHQRPCDIQSSHSTQTLSLHSGAIHPPTHPDTAESAVCMSICPLQCTLKPTPGGGGGFRNMLSKCHLSLGPIINHLCVRLCHRSLSCSS